MESVGPVSFEDSLCSGCASACCRNTFMLLEGYEARDFRDAGSVLIPLQPKLGPVGSRLYFMAGECGNVETDPSSGSMSCKDHDNRPKACRSYKEGGRACDATRKPTTERGK